MIHLALVALLVTTPLIEASRSGDAGAVRALLAAGADVNAPAADGATALHWAVNADDEALVEALIAAGARAEVVNDLAITPLHLAAANGSDRIVRMLLEHGANPNAAASSGVTPMMEAARAGNAAVVRALAAHGGRGDARETARGQTALMWAAARGHSAAVRALLEAGADLRARSTTRRMTVMLDRGPSRTVKTSMQDAHAVEAGGMTALLFAAQGGDPESAALLLAAGADVNDTAASGVSALTLAAFSGHGMVARLLLDKGADPDAAGAGYTALHAAALRGDEATVKALLARRANLNAQLTNGSPVRRFGSQWALPRTMMGATPLMVATAYLETGIMRMLLDAGADPAIPLDNGITPLHVVAGAETGQEARPLDLVRFQVVDADTPIVPRPEEAVIIAAGLLLARGAGVNRASATGDTPLHAAAATGAGAIVRLLAERGASLETVNQAGQTPLALTLPRPAVPGGGRGSPGLPEIEALLRSLGATR